jgi:GTP diphosphokinase / guanosine-3',5'-bis(diphosphate) 3'-diphosphatase
MQNTKDIEVNQNKYILDTSALSKENLESCSKGLWELFQPKISYLDKNDKEVVELAYTQMILSHNQQRRKDGQFYIVHPTSACTILANIGLDRDTLCACLLHDVPEDTNTSLKDLAKDFSPEVIFLIEGVTKLSTIKYQGEDRYAENLRRMFVAMSKDLRVVFIKMADRLHNLQTLAALPEAKRKRIAQESMEIYAPLAERLGMAFFRGEIEELCFKFLYPEEFKALEKQMQEEIGERISLLENVKTRIKGFLKEDKIDCIKVSGRAKKYYSIWSKMKSKDYSMSKIDDLIALRIIVKNVEQCFTALSVVHKNFEAKDSRMKDYITVPKNNGYQSLHTSVYDKETKQVFEVQIRTEAMHEFAEYGVASHWNYKSKNKARSMEKLMDNDSYKWISELVDLGNQGWSQQDYLNHVKLDIFKDRIFVLTPMNDAMDLPLGASVIDFAYRIHQDIGNHAVMGKINDKIAKLSDELKNGDKVEILVDKKQKPSRDWLSFTKTTHATKSIRNFLKNQPNH